MPHRHSIGKLLQTFYLSNCHMSTVTTPTDVRPQLIWDRSLRKSFWACQCATNKPMLLNMIHTDLQYYEVTVDMVGTRWIRFAMKWGQEMKPPRFPASCVGSPLLGLMYLELQGYLYTCSRIYHKHCDLTHSEIGHGSTEPFSNLNTWHDMSCSSNNHVRAEWGPKYPLSWIRWNELECECP